MFKNLFELVFAKGTTSNYKFHIVIHFLRAGLPFDDDVICVVEASKMKKKILLYYSTVGAPENAPKFTLDHSLL